MKKKIAVLGSTGSIGKSLLKIIQRDKKNYQIELLTANTNYKLILNQAKKFNVKNNYNWQKVLSNCHFKKKQIIKNIQ